MKIFENKHKNIFTLIKEINIPLNIDSYIEYTSERSGNTRLILSVSINNNKIALYRSVLGTGGKVKNNWHPVFGVLSGLDDKTNKKIYWFIKGSVEELNAGFGIKALENMIAKLNSMQFNEISKLLKNNNIQKYTDIENFMKNVYGDEGVQTDESLQYNPESHINSILRTIK